MFKKTLYSHRCPDRPEPYRYRLLEDHLNGVRVNALSLFDFFVGKTDFRCLRNAVEKAALYHDIGKALDEFQNYLKSNSKSGPKHSKPSAEFVALLPNLGSGEERFLSAESVLRHHTSIRDKDESANFWINASLDEALNEAKVLANSLEESFFNGGFSENGLEDIINYLEFDMKDEIETYFKLRTVYSVLIAADRFDAVFKSTMDIQKFQFDPSVVVRFVGKLPKSGISKWRDNLKQQVLRKLNKIKQCGVYTLTLPTGAGKTLTSLRVAVEVAQRFEKKSIIYVLPFISIVDQTASIMERIFGNAVQYDHHLAGLEEDESENLTPEKRFISLFRYWMYPVVVTTFAKFWSVLYSPYANDTMNFHRLANAVVVIDEPQSIPVKLWEGFGKTLTYLSRKLNTIFIMMTATQPKMLEKEQKVELAPSNVTFPKSRYSIEFIDKRIKVDEVGSFLKEKIERLGKKPSDISLLAVFNTRRSALIGYESIKDAFDLNPRFLSGWVVPKHRRERLEEIKKALDSGEKLWLVSTQVVEAGVDVDFDAVIRDIGPFDSVVQVAGRCNRNGRNNLGNVFVATFLDVKSGRRTARFVYDSTLLDATEKIFRDRKVLGERDVPDALGDYFREVASKFPKEGPWFRFSNGGWHEGYKELYTDDKGKKEAIVFVDVENGGVKEKLEKILNTHRSLENLAEYKREWKKLQEVSINVPQTTIEKLLNKYPTDDSPFTFMGNGIFLITVDGLGTIYDRKLGFIPPDFREESADDWI